MSIVYYELYFKKGNKLKIVEVSNLDDVASLIAHYLRMSFHLSSIQTCIGFNQFFNKQL